MNIDKPELCHYCGSPVDMDWMFFSDKKYFCQKSCMVDYAGGDPDSDNREMR